MNVKSMVSHKVAQGRRRVLIGVCVGLVVAIALVASVVSLAAASGSTFPDVPATNPYYVAITDLAYRGIVSGFSNGSFGPTDPVTRQQFAKMVVLAGEYPVSESDVCPFVDVVTSGPAGFFPDNYVAVCASHGITTGKTATTFDPYSSITRYQVVSMVARAADDLHPGLLTTPPSTWSGTASWQADPIHGANAARAEYHGLLAGLDLSALNPSGFMSRGEVAQVLYNLRQALAASTTTTTTASTTTTTLVTTTTSSTTTTSTTTTLVGFETLGGALTSAPAAASWATGRLDVFARGTSGELIHLGYNGFWATDWQDLGGSIALDSSPAAVASAVHPLDVFVRGQDDTLWHKYYSGSTWSAWDSQPGAIASSPAATSAGSGTFEVFARSATGTLLLNTYDSITWSGWLSLGGVIKAGSEPAAVSWGPGRLDVFVRGADDALWHMAWNGGWTAWEKLGGTLTSSPTVASTMLGHLDVFARGPGNTIWHRSYSDENGWAAWENMAGGAVTSAPAAVSWGINRIDLFARAGGNVLCHKWWDGSVWRP